MKHFERLEIFERARAKYAGFLTSVLWKLTGDRELFAEALQYALLEMWRRVEKLNGEKAGAYLYRIVLTANSKAWRNRVGRDGQISKAQLGSEKEPQEKILEGESAKMVRRAIAQLPAKQARAIVMRYLEQKDYSAIAEKLNCSEAGARSHVSKAMATLKGRLAPAGEQE